MDSFYLITSTEIVINIPFPTSLRSYILIVNKMSPLFASRISVFTYDIVNDTW